VPPTPTRAKLAFDFRWRVQPVDLVEHQHLGQILGTDLGEHAVDLLDVLVPPRIAHVDHVQ
jgi:hypothetical protein